MQIYFGNMTRPRLVAKALKKSLTGLGHDFALARCQAATSQMFGYQDWHDMLKRHAAGGPSLDDCDCTPENVSHRRGQYIRCLLNAGVDVNHVEQVVDAVRPTARSGGKSMVSMDGLPQFLLEAFEIDEERARVRSLGMQDLTSVVVRAMVPYSDSKVREVEDPPLMQTLGEGLTIRARELGWKRKLSLPGFKEGLEEFISAVGSRAAMPAYRKHLSAIRDEARSLEDAVQELATVRAAKFSTDFKANGMVYSTHELTEYHSGPEEAYDDWGWDEYIKQHPQPSFEVRMASDAWDVAYGKWVAENAPPFLFGTNEMHWDGIDPADLRLQIEEDGTADASVLVENGLSDHYDDAANDVVDEVGIDVIVKEWAPHAGKGTPEDLALEEKVAAWNAKQRIMSYYPNFKIILPSREGHTKEDAIAWCSRRVAEVRAELDGMSRWTPPVTVAAEMT